MALEFLKPARIDEVLEVTTRAKETTAATLILDQRISRDGVDLFTAEVMVVLVSASGKPLRLSAALREALQDEARRHSERSPHFAASVRRSHIAGAALPLTRLSPRRRRRDRA